MNQSQPSTSTSVLSLQGISKAFGKRVICRRASFELDLGHWIAIVGPNGSGKSTLVKMIAGLMRPDHGRIAHFALGLPLKPDQGYRHIGLVSPELALYEELTALENMEFGNQVGDWNRQPEEFEGCLEEMGLGGRGHDYLNAYSSGMKQRMKFVLAFLKNPTLLLLDEPTANLDPEGADRVWAALDRRQTTVVIATNDASEAARAPRQFVMGPQGGMRADA